MDEAQARASIERSVAAGSSPALTASDVDALVALAARADSGGWVRGDVEWTPTWNLAAGIAEGWRYKAAKAAGNFDFAADGLNVSKNQVYKAAMEQAAYYQEQAYQYDVALAASEGYGTPTTIQVTTAATAEHLYDHYGMENA